MKNNGCFRCSSAYGWTMRRPGSSHSPAGTAAPRRRTRRPSRVGAVPRPERCLTPSWSRGSCGLWAKDTGTVLPSISSMIGWIPHSLVSRGVTKSRRGPGTWSLTNLAVLTPTWSLSSSAWSVHARATRLERCNRFRAERISLSVETTTESGHGRIQRDDIATLLSYSFLILAGNDKAAVNESLQELLADKVSVGGQAVRGNR